MSRPGNNSVGAPAPKPATQTTTPTAEPPNPAAPGPPPAPAPTQSSASQPTSAGSSGNISTPNDWAAAQLQYMGLPATQNNISFLVSWAAREGGNWQNTAMFNPLNTTLQYNGSTVMGGGNSAGVQAYGSWQDGLAATAQTLQGYPKIMSALESGNPWPANNSGQLAGELQTWSGSGYTQVGQNTVYGNTTGGPTSSTGQGTVPNAVNYTDSSGAQIPAPPADAADLDKYIQQYFGTDAWMLTTSPELKALVEKIASEGRAGDTAYVTGLIQQTQWWKQTSAAVKNYVENSKNNPADYSFTTPGSKASQALAQVNSTAGQNGVVLDPHTAQNLAQNFLQYGWTTQQLQQAIGSHASAGNATSITQQLQNMAMQYYMPVNPNTLTSWAQNIAAGTQTLGQFQAQMANDAAQKWTGFAPQLQSGSTMQQLTDSLRTEAAKTMEVDPNSINFLNDPMYSKILDYVPPNSPNGVHRVMTLSEMNQYLKSTKPYGYTQGARDSAASLEQAITTSFGKVG